MASGLIILLLAAILIVLLGIWGKLPGVIAGVLGVILFIVVSSITASYIGELWTAAILIGLPLVALIVFGFYEVAHGRMDMWGNSIQKNSIKNKLQKKLTKNKPIIDQRELKSTIVRIRKRQGRM